MLRMKESLTTILCCLLLSCNQKMTTASARDQSVLYQYWVHSFEDDSRENSMAKYKTYRPSTYHFPPARGRDAFEIKEHSVFISHPIAPADGNLTITEKWELDNDKLTITGKTAVTSFKIVSLSKEKLVLEPLLSQ